MSFLPEETGVTFSSSTGSLSPIWMSSLNRFPCSPTQIHIVKELRNRHKVDGKWYITRPSYNCVTTRSLFCLRNIQEGCCCCGLFPVRNTLSACIFSCLWPPLFSDVSNSPAMIFTDGFGIFLALLFMISCKCKKTFSFQHFTSNILNCTVYFCLSDTSCVAAMIHNLAQGDCISPAIWRLLVWSQPTAYYRRSQTPGWLSLCSFRCITVIQVSWHLESDLPSTGKSGSSAVWAAKVY